MIKRALRAHMRAYWAIVGRVLMGPPGPLQAGPL